MKNYIKNHIKNVPDRRTAIAFIAVLLSPTAIFILWWGTKSHWSAECFMHIMHTAYN